MKYIVEFLSIVGLYGFFAPPGLPDPSLVNGPLTVKEDRWVRITHNQVPWSADLDVYDNHGRPIFRLLIPECLSAEGIPDLASHSHILPGVWGEEGGIHWGRIPVNERVEEVVAVMPLENGVLVLVGIRNLSQVAFKNLTMDVCVSVSHLPSETSPWVNPLFIKVPEPLDRDSAGRFWYEKVAPYRLKAFVDGQWKPAHRDPSHPSWTGIPPYDPYAYLDTPASVMAVESFDGGKRLVQAWESPGKARCAFPGNSCMHLEPLLSEKLPPGQIAWIRGEISLTNASWSNISKWNPERFRKEYSAMKTILGKLGY